MSISTTDLPELLKIAIKILVEGEEALSFDNLVRRIGRQRGQVLDAEEQNQFERLLRREAAALIRPPEQTGEGWEATLEARIFVEKNSTDYEEQTPPPFQTSIELLATDAILKPFNPTLIRVETEQMPIYHALKLIRDGRIKLDPEFQRNFIWDRTRQSRLIESLLLRIPLPAFYLDATRDSTYVVVDGRQRLTTLDEFCNKQTFALTGLEYLDEHDNKKFSDLPLSLQTSITERTKLTVYTILPETPEQVKFMIFSRVNTGGLTLTAQEIRHAMFQGQATQVLNRLAMSADFLNTTAYSISTKRMDDRECVLRFLAFHFNPYEEFGTKLSPEEPANLDGFLNRTMMQLNQFPPTTLEQTEEIFRSSMIKAHHIFGSYAFRKLYRRNDRRMPISKPLFEVWGVLLRDYTLERLDQQREAIVDGFIDIMTGDNDFVSSISYGTGSVASVKYRFNRIRRLLQEVMV